MLERREGVLEGSCIRGGFYRFLILFFPLNVIPLYLDILPVNSIICGAITGAIGGVFMGVMFR